MPLPLSVPRVPPDTVMSELVKSVEDSLKVKAKELDLVESNPGLCVQTVAEVQPSLNGRCSDGRALDT